MKKPVYVYDIEQFANLHTCTFVHAEDEADTHHFVIWDESWNDFKEYVSFLSQDGLRLIGFNCLNYDYPMLDFILRQNKYLEGLSPLKLNAFLYERNQQIIQSEFQPVPNWNIMIPQRDLYRIHHYDNKNRRTSLKHLQVAMKWLNVEDMPFPYDHWIQNEDEVKIILKYNHNDTLSTKRFYEMSQDEIAVRRQLTKKYGINLMNAPDAKIGAEIILSTIAKRQGVQVKHLKSSNGTDRGKIPLTKVILPSIKFESKPFQKVLKTFKETTALGFKLKGSFSASAMLDDMQYDFGFGGIHAARPGRIYRSTPEISIETADVSSYYPNIGIKNRFYPEHLSETFCDVQEELYTERKGYPRDTPENYGLKISLNAAFGKSNEERGPFRDPKYTLDITVNGQLQLAMLCEKLTLAGFHVIIANTDGIETLVPPLQRELYLSICKQWEQDTGLDLEYGQYEVMAIRDVNNYIARKTDGRLKSKGDYELAQTRAENHMWHKSPSGPIIPYAVMRHLFYGDNLLELMRGHPDILDFCMYARAKGKASFFVRKLDGEGNLEDTKIQKTVRYFVSRYGSYLVKVFEEGRETKFHKTHKVMLANRVTERSLKLFSDSRDRWLDYGFYINECMKLIIPLKNRQSKLFEI